MKMRFFFLSNLFIAIVVLFFSFPANAQVKRGGYHPHPAPAPVPEHHYHYHYHYYYPVYVDNGWDDYDNSTWSSNNNNNNDMEQGSGNPDAVWNNNESMTNLLQGSGVQSVQQAPPANTAANTAGGNGQVKVRNRWQEQQAQNANRLNILVSGNLLEHPENLPRVAWYIKAFKQRYPNTIAVDSGNIISSVSGPDAGGLAKLKPHGALMFHIMRVIPYDGMTLGNQDYQLGIERLAALITQWRLPYLAANITASPTPLPVNKYRILNVNGLKVGIIGFAASDLSSLPADDAGKYKVAAPVPAFVTKLVDELKPQVDIVVLITNESDEADRTLANQVNGINVIAGGQTPHKICEYNQNGNVVILKAGRFGNYLGKAVLYLNPETHKVQSADLDLVKVSTYSQLDQRVMQLLEEYGYEIY